MTIITNFATPLIKLNQSILFVRMLLSCSYGENRLFWVVIVNWTSLTVKHIALKVQRTKCIIIYHLRKWLFKSLLEKCEDTTGVIIDCMSIKGQTLIYKTLTEKTIEQHTPHKNRWWIRVLWKGKHFLLHWRH